MKAVVLKGTSQVSVEDVEDPRIEVEEVGDAVVSIRRGERVVLPFNMKPQLQPGRAPASP